MATGLQGTIPYRPSQYGVTPASEAQPRTMPWLAPTVLLSRLVPGPGATSYTVLGSRMLSWFRAGRLFASSRPYIPRRELTGCAAEAGTPISLFNPAVVLLSAALTPGRPPRRTLRRVPRLAPFEFHHVWTMGQLAAQPHSRMGFEPRPYTVSRNEEGGP